MKTQNEILEFSKKSKVLAILRGKQNEMFANATDDAEKIAIIEQMRETNRQMKEVNRQMKELVESESVRHTWH